MLEKRFCPYCGEPISNGCDCEAEIAACRAEQIDDIEERQMETEWQQDLIDMRRFER